MEIRFQIDFIFSSFVYLCFHIGTDKMEREKKPVVIMIVY